MTWLSSLLLLAGVYLLVLASPGPNFFILSQLALTGRHREARRVVYGLTTASVAWAIIALAGVGTVLSHYPTLAVTLRVLGAAYLIWYGARLLISAMRPVARREVAASTLLEAVPAPTQPSCRPAWRTGLLTGLTNPKGAAFWTSAFAATMPTIAPGWYPAVVLLLVTALSLAWHLGITWMFASRPLRAAYLRAERAINGTAGAVIIALGLQRLAGR